MNLNTTKTYKLGLALSGGGAKGFAHLGVLKFLDEKGIRPDIISGTSAGALAGVLYADGHSPEEILSFFEKKSFKQFAEFTIPHSGLFKTDRLKQFLKKHLRAKKFEDLKIPLRVIATNIENGQSTMFNSGELIPSIIASCAYPIIFTPIKIKDSFYVDGGLFKNFPVSTIKKECEIVIGVNVTPLNKQEYKDSLLYVAERTFHYVSIANAGPDRHLCNILIEPLEVSKFAMFTLDHTHEIYGIGYNAIKNNFEAEAKNLIYWDELLTYNSRRI